MAAFQRLLNHPSDSSAPFPPFSPESACFISLARFPGVAGLRLLPAGERASCGLPRILTPRPAGKAVFLMPGDEFLSHVL